MEPRIKFEERYDIDYKNKIPKRFEIIEFKYNDNFYDKNDFYSSNQHISRVIGMPNETIEIINGDVYINYATPQISDSKLR
jgi:signal peptidase I